MEKYLGNKRAMLLAIDEVVSTHCPGASSFCDLLAGTTNVGRYFRRKGHVVTSNDANRFAFILGATYLTNAKPLTFSGLNLAAPPKAAVDLVRRHFEASVRRDSDMLFPTASSEAAWAAWLPAARVLAWLNAKGDSARETSGPIVEHFTAGGSKARFCSMRGSVGQRNYFSLENARKLDWILAQIREWTQDGSLTFQETCYLLCAVLEEVVLVANVNGTFHDFNRDRLWPNSLQPLTLRLPLVDHEGPAGHVYCDDAFALAPKLPTQDVVYIDPPYNFRQYSAYYHLLNLLAAWPFLEDLDGYLEELTFVRGQNMRDDFSSPLCFRDEFISALRQLTCSLSSRWVVLSYFGGRNHWNHWSKGDELRDEGSRLLTELFEDRSLFSSSVCVPVLRTRLNYQSRVGERKHLVNEHLFVGERKVIDARRSQPRIQVSKLNAGFGLHQFTASALRGGGDRREPVQREPTVGVAREKGVGRNTVGRNRPETRHHPIGALPDIHLAASCESDGARVGK